MITITYAITTLVVLTAAYIVLKKALGAYLKFRGARIIICPENCKHAAVEVDTGRAALTAISGEPKLQLKNCSRWPELQDCGQDCLRQIELSPEECLVRNILADWYRGKKCIHCGKPIGEIDWLENKPALQTPQGLTVQCSEIPPELLPDVLSTHLPVCFDCHVAERFRRLYPDLVVDRTWKTEVHRGAK